MGQPDLNSDANVQIASDALLAQRLCFKKILQENSGFTGAFARLRKEIANLRIRPVSCYCDKTR